ncbi:hypothetical protein B0T17DRAFT_509063 [Bombardia bombarda]|uniref:Uncharacterized protein n=1 Tax=Bombardia bombarda TaxID=252184 RepID=A0AA40C1W1_9PEZI|nr:hypothetical protein B0T17DRAFT_509063 [Bombardia bombarda]
MATEADKVIEQEQPVVLAPALAVGAGHKTVIEPPTENNKPQDKPVAADPPAPAIATKPAELPNPPAESASVTMPTANGDIDLGKEVEAKEAPSSLASASDELPEKPEPAVVDPAPAPAPAKLPDVAPAAPDADKAAADDVAKQDISPPMDITTITTTDTTTEKKSAEETSEKVAIVDNMMEPATPVDASNAPVTAQPSAPAAAVPATTNGKPSADVGDIDVEMKEAPTAAAAPLPPAPENGVAAPAVVPSKKRKADDDDDTTTNIAAKKAKVDETTVSIATTNGSANTNGNGISNGNGIPAKKPGRPKKNSNPTPVAPATVAAGRTARKTRSQGPVEV